jgi:hypothetical protein
MKPTLITIILLLNFLGSTSNAQWLPQHPRGEESISGKTFLAIQVAAAEATRNGVDVSKYKIFAEKAEYSYIITFDDPERPPGQVGSTTRMLSFEVEVSIKDLHIIRSHFVR